MLKRITLLARRTDLTFEAFSNHWLRTHAEIVKRMPMVYAYIQNPVANRLLKCLNPDDPFSFDGIVELWFADQAAQRTAFASDAARELPTDELNFIRGITIYPVEEERLTVEAFPVKVMLVTSLGAAAKEKVVHTNALVERLASMKGSQVVAVNHLGQAGWREHLWHEPSPPDALLELGFASELEARAFTKLPEMVAMHSALSDAGGLLECYVVSPRKII